MTANKYCLDDLKVLCEDFINDNLTVEHAFRYFTLANAHNAFKLKAKTAEVIKENAEGIVGTREYKLYEQSHPHECCELLRSLMFKRFRPSD